ncbi:unnamed protein product [Haemonchus placei]|uniref:Peptidase_M13_N domain-containing protein n=1 Tax=Haemonchus placei TaxID=6290 RepID=A0A0N4X7I5_HAEPC|nr:unnamed protein product [Haemonchus placei]
MIEGHDKFRAEDFDLTSLMIHVKEVRGLDVFVSNYVTPERKNVSRRLLHFDQADLGLGASTRDYYLDRVKHGKKIEAYRQFLIDQVKLINEYDNRPSNDEKIAKDVGEIIDFETRIAKIMVAEEDRQDSFKMYNLRHLSDMQKLMPVELHCLMYGKKQKAPTWEECTSSTMHRMQYATGAIYVRKVFDKVPKNETLDMVNDLIEAFNEMLVENDWMDKSTKKTVKGMLRNIAYPGFILDSKKLDNYYKGVSEDILRASPKFSVDETDSYSQMIEKLSRWYIEFDFKRLTKLVDRTEYVFNPAVVDAYYSRYSNSISRQYDAIGNLRDWWDAGVKKKFVERAQCIIDQYGKIEVPGTGLKVNGKLTQGENIADNGGVKQALRVSSQSEFRRAAYRKYLKRYGEEKRIEGLEQYNNEQMFFVGYATICCGHSTKDALINSILTDTHSPTQYRYV